jgi:hypothetical protein
MFRYIQREWVKSLDAYTKFMGPPMVAILAYGYYDTFIRSNMKIIQQLANTPKSDKKNES